MMRRKPMKPGTSQLKRTGFARGDRIEAREVTKLQRAAPARKAAMKTKGPRMTPIRRAAQGRDCTIRLPGICNFNPETTVLCHSNSLVDGKGMGLKAPDTAAAFGCCACHDVLDGRRPRPTWLTAILLEAAFYAAVARTHEILRRLGLMPAAPTTIESEEP